MLAAVVALPGCEDEHEDEHGDEHGEAHEGEPSGAGCKEGSTLTWDSFGEKFMTDYCTRCHASSLAGAARQGAPSDLNFESAPLVRVHTGHIDQQAAGGPAGVNTAMPLGAPAPTEAERSSLGEWLACGAP